MSVDLPNMAKCIDYIVNLDAANQNIELVRSEAESPSVNLNDTNNISDYSLTQKPFTKSMISNKSFQKNLLHNTEQQKILKKRLTNGQSKQEILSQPDSYPSHCSSSNKSPAGSLQNLSNDTPSSSLESNT